MGASIDPNSAVAPELLWIGHGFVAWKRFGLVVPGVQKLTLHIVDAAAPAPARKGRSRARDPVSLLETPIKVAAVETCTRLHFPPEICGVEAVLGCSSCEQIAGIFDVGGGGHTVQ